MYLKQLYIILLLFTVCLSSNAQNREFIVGTMVGFYGIHIVGDTKEMYSATYGNVAGSGGLSFGFNVKRYFSDNFYGAFELRYIRKGSVYEFITNYNTRAFEIIKLDYIEFPVIFGAKINMKKKYLLFETGFAYARLMNYNMLVNDLNQWDPSLKINNFEQNDFSWVANLKYPIIKNKKLLLGLRVSYSLISIHSVYDLYNMDYGIEIYYLFNRNIN